MVYLHGRILIKPNLPSLYTKLTDVYKKHGNLIIAVDFDDTLYDWKSQGYDCDYVVDLVKRCSLCLNAKIMLFTCREGELLEFATDYCKSKGIELWGINFNPDIGFTSSKPFYNVLLDDKACLSNVCSVLENIIQDVVEDYNNRVGVS